MITLTHISTAIKQLLANKGKSALTMLGVVIGIGSVIFIMTMGEVAKNFLLTQISQFGTNVIEIMPTSEIGMFASEDDIVLTDDDVEALQNSSLLPELTKMSAGVMINETGEYNGEKYSLTIMGDSHDYFTINNTQLLHGRFFNMSENKNHSKVIVIGEQLAEDAFNTIEDALNKYITIDGTSFKIIGIVEDISTGGMPVMQTIVYAPLNTVRKLYVDADEQSDVQYFLVEFAAGSDADGFEKRLSYELKKMKGVDQDDETTIMIMSRKYFLDIFDSILMGIQLFVSAIAAISLLVGGIGIMNIMLVTVRERTKEIGLRKAVGAKNRSILFQFLIEAIVLTTTGGIVGILFGLGLSFGSVLLVNIVQPSWGLTFEFVPISLVLACGVSITTGIVFGLYPAWKASRLHPIESLRYE